ncbi:AMP-binding protein [Williamsia sp. CHRR-6]|uniref:AMP-binding protein n=1 Tax=Williamsia sp. CHRR-6 TaxID=2835871 RepID=UPI001BD91712|nr:AMP-binding protein [Williamsia sp. CHRR-6]MBT0565802.1 AMP-binding protein [Williamsia sp. CHRR-6]
MPTALLRSVTDTARSIVVLQRRGVLELTRPDLAVLSFRTAKQFGPLAGVVANAVARDPSTPAVIDDAGTITYGELDSVSNALARGLIERGVTAGGVVGIMCRDHRWLVATTLATNRIGARALLLNTGFGAPALAAVVDRESATVIVADTEFTGLLSVVPDTVERVIAWGATDGDVSVHDLLVGRSSAPMPRPPAPGGLVLLTSGTTGVPKGAPRDRVNPLVTAQLVDRVPVPRGGVVVSAAPIFHGTGLAMGLIGMALGNAIALQRRFDPERTLRLISDNKARMAVMVPTMLQRILDLDPQIRGRYDCSSLEVILVAGSALAPDLCERARVEFGDVLHNLYGSTEVAVATVAGPDDLKLAPGTVGRPPAGCRVALYDDAGQAITTPHTTGRIFVSSSLSFGGYTDGRTKQMIDGLMSSGDMGYVDDNGLWFVVGRDDDMIVSGGENVYPLEIENLLHAHPDVCDVAVIGVDDRDFGQRLCAIVVVEPGTHLDVDTVKDHVRANLARFKVPREVIFVDELPRNATGKIDRRGVAELVQRALHPDAAES